MGKTALQLERFMKNVSQVRLSALTGLNQMKISRVERGVRLPTPSEAAVIAKALCVEVGDLWANPEGKP